MKSGRDLQIEFADRYAKDARQADTSRQTHFASCSLCPPPEGQLCVVGDLLSRVRARYIEYATNAADHLGQTFRL